VQSWPLERPEPGSRSTAGCCCPARGLSTVGLLEWPRALRRRGFIGDHSDAIRLRTPDGLCRLIGRRACVEDHLRPVTGGTDRSRCRRLGSPQSSREVPAETQEEPAGTGRGTGTQRKDRWSGGRRPRGGRREPGGRSGRWRCRSGARSPTACDPSASLPRPAPSRPERAWPFAYPARSSAGPTRTSVGRSSTGRSRTRLADGPRRPGPGGEPASAAPASATNRPHPSTKQPARTTVTKATQLGSSGGILRPLGRVAIARRDRATAARRWDRGRHPRHPLNPRCA
jgi:hypothetical protein